MSRKLLMINGKFEGYIYNRTLSSDKAPGTIDFGEEKLTPAYSYGYLMEATAMNIFHGATIDGPALDYYTIADTDEGGKYVYTLVSKSADGTKKKTKQFKLDYLIDEVDRTECSDSPGVYSDRLYWDEKLGEYMIELRTKRITFNSSDGWLIPEYYYTDMYDTISYDFRADSNSEYYTEYQMYTNGYNSNYYKADKEWSALGTGNYEACAVRGWGEMNVGTGVKKNGIQYRNKLGKQTAYMTKDELDNLFEIPMQIVYVAGVPGDDPINDCVRLVHTGITKKIKVPLFGEGSTFSLERTVNSYTVYGSVKIDVPCTDSVIYELFEGESITPSFSSDTHVFCEDEPIYLEEVNGVHYYARNSDGVTTATYNVHAMRTLGTPLDNGKYEYIVTATSADGMKTKDIKFAMDYQLLYYVTPNKMYWNDELGCYDVLMYTGYEYITNVDNFGTLKYGDYTIFTKETDDGKVAYDGGNSSGVLANGTFHQADRNSIYAYTHTVTNGSTENGYTIGLCIHDVHTAEEFNAKIAENGPIQVFYRHNTEKIYHTDIKKKIELPWFGEGTTYTLKNGDLSSNFKIGLPTKYEHKIFYKTYKSLKRQDNSKDNITLQPIIKDLDVYDICYSYDSYIDTIINPVYEYKYESFDVSVDNGDGTYSYNLEVATRTINPDTGGAIIVPQFRQEIKLPYHIDSWTYSSNVNSRDRFYWDDESGQYLLEKNSIRMVIDSAYGDVEFKPYSYSANNLDRGYSWEFAIPDNCDMTYVKTSGTSEVTKVNSNYHTGSFASANANDTNGAIFYPLYNSTIEGNSLALIYKYATTLDILDQHLKTKPLIITFPTLTPTTIPTGIKKKITLPITESMCKIGIQVTMTNTNSEGTVINGYSETNGILTIKVPVEYKMIEVPEPTYQLPAETILTGSSSGGYINTNVKLFDTAKDSTVIIDFNNFDKNGESFTPDNGDIVFHCRNESSTNKYRGFALVYENTYNTWRMMGNTTYNNGNLGSYEYASLSNCTGESGMWRYRYAFIFKAGILERAVNLMAESNSSVKIPAPARFYDEELYPDKAAFGTYTGTAYIGRKGSSSANYYQGTIKDCKIWAGVALTNEQLQALYERPYPKPTYELAAPNTFNQSYIDTGVRLYDQNRDFSILLEYDATQDYAYSSGFSDTAGYAVLSSNLREGASAGGLALMYRPKYGDYRLEFCGAENMLKSGGAISPEFGRMSLIIMYKQGLPYRVINCTSGVPVDLELRTDMYTVGTYGFNVILGASYHEDTSSYAGYWMGTINKCMIWRDKVLTDGEIDYLVKYVCN